MRIHHILLVLLASTSFQSRAYDLQRSMDNLAEDVSACVAFYTIVAVDAKRNAVQDARWGEVATKYEATLQRALDLLRLTMTEGPSRMSRQKLISACKGRSRRCSQRG